MFIVSEMRSFVFQYDSPEQWIVFVVASSEFSMESKEATAEEERTRRNKENAKNRINIGIRHDSNFFSTINHVLIIRVLNAWTTIEAHKRNQSQCSTRHKTSTDKKYMGKTVSFADEIVWHPDRVLGVRQRKSERKCVLYSLRVTCAHKQWYTQCLCK